MAIPELLTSTGQAILTAQHNPILVGGSEDGASTDVVCSQPVILIGDGNWKLQRVEVKSRREERA